jgi:hypothetical protein
MTTPTTAKEALEQAALEPKSVSESGRTIVNRDLRELADIAKQQAPDKPHFGLRFTKLIPPGGG